MDIADKVRALFAKANNEATTTAERDAFTAKANELMIRHALAESDLAAEDNPEDFGHETIHLGPASDRSHRLLRLLTAIAKPHGAYVVFSKEWADNVDPHTTRSPLAQDRIAHVYGRSSTIGGVLAMYERLSIDAVAGAAAITARPGMRGWNPTISAAANTRRMRNGYLDGYAVAIGARLVLLNTETDEANNGALFPVLASDYDRAKDLAGDVRTVKSSMQKAGFVLGAEHGDRANLATAAMPTSPLALGS